MSKSPATWPAGISRKQKLAISGRRGREKSNWNHGFDAPLSVADTDKWAQRKAEGRKP
jgi:hypothetical protein